MASKVVEIMAAQPYRRGKNVEGVPMNHPAGISYRLLAGEEYPAGLAEELKADSCPVDAAMVKELNRQPSLISARVISLGDDPMSVLQAEAASEAEPASAMPPIPDPSPTNVEEGNQEAAADDASPYAVMGWQDLLKLGRDNGINVNGLKRPDVEAALAEKNIPVPE